MSLGNRQYDGPLVSVSVTRSSPDSSVSKYNWEVALSAPNVGSDTKLGYMASGVLADLNTSLGQFEVKVHDKDRKVWTPMPLSHRGDIRERIEKLVHEAIHALKSGGHV